jgi:hypothetical protein
MSEAAVTGGMAGAGLGQRVVVGAGQVDPRLARYEVGARAGDRQHLHGNAGGVHVRQPRVAEIREFVAPGGLSPDEVGSGKAAPGDCVRRDAGDDAGDRVVLFQGDDAHVVLCRMVGWRIACWWRARHASALCNEPAICGADFLI